MANLSNDPNVGVERVIAPSRRPDGSLRKEIRIRAGYTPQDEVAIYQPKGAQLRKGPDVPPGYDPALASTKPKTKAAKKNEKRKEKKQQVSTANSSDLTTVASSPSQESRATDDSTNLSEKLSTLSVSTSSKEQQIPSSEDGGPSTVELEKRIRALKKKIRLTESKQNSAAGTSVSAEQAEKVVKLEGWRQELQDLEASLASL